MRLITIVLVISSVIGCQSTQTNQKIMDDSTSIKEAITKLFINTDKRDWSGVEAQFNSEVTLDYSSMSGNPATKLSPQEITGGWKTVLPGFTFTHHQIGNFITEVNGNTAKSFCYGTATHYLENENGKVWTVVGTYDFDLLKVNDKWKISGMKFNFKYQDGNTKLIQEITQNNTSSEDLATRNKNTVKSFFKALTSENAESVAELFAKNGKQINPYHSDLFPKGANGKEEIRNYWKPVFPNFDGMTFPIQEIYAMEDPNIVYVKYTGNIQLKNNSGVYSNDYYSTFKFNDQGKITEYVEIFNPIVAAKAFGLIDKIQ